MLGLLFRAIVFSLLITLPYFSAYIAQGPDSPGILTDADEVVYLRRTIDTADNLGMFSFYDNTTRPTFELIREDTSFLTQRLIAISAKSLNLSPFELGLTLDLLLAFLGYLAFTWALLPLCKQRFTSEFSAALLLFFPWSLTLNYYLRVPVQQLLQNLVPSTYIYQLSQPILRGTMTQVSLPLFAIAIGLALRLAKSQTTSLKPHLVCGVICGLLGYVYFFAWIASAFFCFTIIAIRPGGASLKKRGLEAIMFLLSFAVVSTPALYLQWQNSADVAFRFSEISKYWFFPLELVALSLIVLLLRRTQIGKQNELLIYLWLTCLVAEICLMNLQPILGVGIAPYRFSELYIQPLSTAVVCILFINTFAESPRSQALVNGFIALTVFAGVYYSGITTLNRINSPNSETREFTELTAYLREETSNSATLAVMSFRAPFRRDLQKTVSFSHLPSLIASLTKRKILHQDWYAGRRNDTEQRIYRELNLGFAFSERPQLLWPCIEKVDDLPGDLFAIVWSYFKLRRVRECASKGHLLATASICKLNKLYPFDYIVWEKKYGLQKPDWYQNAAKSVWMSSKGTFEVLKVNRDELKQLYC